MEIKVEQKAVEQTIYVIGHINPDTDSICSAIAYAELKNKLGKGRYKARRAGQINAETQFVLKKFGIKQPGYLSDVRTQVKDLEYRIVEGMSRDMSIKKAWELMSEKMVSTMPILKPDGVLEGLITIPDIARTYMDIYDREILSKSNTTIANIVETLTGELICGDMSGKLLEGKVLIAAANPDLMESYIKKNDIVILGNRYESQLCAIEMEAGCIIVCEGAQVSKTIQKLGQEKGCAIIVTPYDTFTVARLINQSIPVGYFMKSDNLIAFTTEDYIEDIKQVMAKQFHRDFPIYNMDGTFAGMVSRRNLLGARRKKLILVDHNERSQAVDGLEDADILEIIDHHRLGSLETMGPIFFRNQPLGCTATIVYQMYKENGVEIRPQIAGLLCSAIISDTLIFKSPTCTYVDIDAANELAKIAGIDPFEYAKEMFTEGSMLNDKTPEEIFYQDFKKFTAADMSFGIGQITSLDQHELENVEKKVESYIEKAYKEHDVDMVMFMLTDIMSSTTKLIYMGNAAKDVIERAFKIEAEGDAFYLPGVVSRKKQLVPAIMMALQDNN